MNSVAFYPSRQNRAACSARQLSRITLLAITMASFVAWLGLLSVCSPVFGQTSAPDNLNYDWRAALKVALEADENVRAQRQEIIHARKSRNAFYSSAAIPRISFSGEGGVAFADVNNPNAAAEVMKPYADVSLEITQKIKDGGERKAGLRDHRLTLQIARTGLLKAEQEIISHALYAYVNFRYNTLLFIAQQRRANVLTSVSRQNAVSAQQDNATALWDTWRLRQTAQEGENALLQDKKALDASRGVFAAAFRFVPDANSMAHVDLPLDLIPRTFEESLQVARRSNPAYHIQTQEAQRTTNALLRARSKGIPSLSMVAEGRYRYNPLPETFHDRSANELLAYAGLRIDWSLADTFRLKSLVGAARAEAGVAEGERGRFAHRHRHIVAEAWNDLVSLSAQYSAQRRFGIENALLFAAIRNTPQEEASPTRIIELEAQFLQTQVQLLDTERRLTLAYITLLGEMGLLSRATLNI